MPLNELFEYGVALSRSSAAAPHLTHYINNQRAALALAAGQDRDTEQTTLHLVLARTLSMVESLNERLARLESATPAADQHRASFEFARATDPELLRESMGEDDSPILPQSLHVPGIGRVLSKTGTESLFMGPDGWKGE